MTLGIYYLVWYYKINRELRDLGRATGQEERLGRSPFTSLMAITFGWLILVPPFVSIYRTLQAHPGGTGNQRHAGEPINVWLGFVLYLVGVFTFPVEIIYAQSELNRLWRTAPEAKRSCPRPPDVTPCRASRQPIRIIAANIIPEGNPLESSRNTKPSHGRAPVASRPAALLCSS